MRRIFVLSMLLAFVTICSCQKQDSTAEAQLAQPKTELDAREEALIRREKAAEEREKAVAEREKALASSGIIRSQRQAPEAAQAEAERQRRIQQLPPEIKALIPDRSRGETGNAAKDSATQERLGQSHPGLDQLQRNRQRKLEAIQKWQTSGAATSPAAEITSSTPSPVEEESSVNPSATPE